MNKIKEARAKTGMNRKEVAMLLEMPYRTLENWENGVNYPAPYIERLIIKELEEYTPADAKAGNIVTNDYGIDIDYDIAVNMMDDEIREQLHEELVMQSDQDCTEQKFFDEYCKAHEEKYGEEWELAKENPCY
ncbi:MAG: helix-turn-helix transcriptional regulator [Ruminococcus sp.]|nr:helix-turn-helix transcriptional regulator [Ruminococcus sp.]